MQFTHEHLEIQKTLKRFIDEEINPHVDEWEAAEMFPAHQVFKRLGDLGLLGLTKPEEYGGAGLTLTAAAAVLEEIQHAGCNGGACHAQMYIMGTLLRHGSPEQKRKYLQIAVDAGHLAQELQRRRRQPSAPVRARMARAGP